MNWRIKYGSFILIIAIVALSLVVGDIFKILQSPIKLETVEQAKNLKSGDTVNLDITMIVGDMISETTTLSRHGQKISSSESARYYVVPIYDFKKSDQWFVTIKLESGEFDKADKGIAAFENFSKTNEIPTEVLFSIYGVVKDMSDEERKYVPSELDDVMNMIYISKLSKAKTLIVSAIAIVLFITGIVLIVLYLKDKKMGKVKLEKTKINNPDYYQAPQNIYV